MHHFLRCALGQVVIEKQKRGKKDSYVIFDNVPSIKLIVLSLLKDKEKKKKLKIKTFEKKGGKKTSKPLQQAKRNKKRKCFQS